MFHKTYGNHYIKLTAHHIYGYLKHCFLLIYFIDGQAIAIKLSNQINKVVTAMRKFINSLNEVSNEQVAFESIKDPQADIYLPTGSTNNSSIPVSVKKKMINLLFTKDRCKEEITMIGDEMARFISFKSKEISLISNKTEEINMTQFGVGLKSLLLQKAASYQNELSHLKQLWGNLIEYPLEEFSDHVTHLSFSKLVATQEDMAELHELYDVEAAIDLFNNNQNDTDSENDNIDCWDNL